MIQTGNGRFSNIRRRVFQDFLKIPTLKGCFEPLKFVGLGYRLGDTPLKR